MNKKDVLGASADAGNVQKMESIPYLVECWKSSKYGTHTMIGKAWFWLYLVSDTMPKQKLKSFNYFSRELNV